MINLHSSQSVNPHYGRRPSNVNLGMPDPSKVPNYKPGRTLEEIQRPEQSIIPNYDKYLRDKPGIMGGWDAPMFYDGRVMSRREYAQLHDLGLA